MAITGGPEKTPGPRWQREPGNMENYSVANILSSKRKSKRTKQFSKDRFVWLEQVLADPDLPDSAFKVAYSLASKYFNEQRDGMAWAGLHTIAAAVRLNKSNVLRNIRRLAKNGH